MPRSIPCDHAACLFALEDCVILRTLCWDWDQWQYHDIAYDRLCRRAQGPTLLVPGEEPSSQRFLDEDYSQMLWAAVQMDQRLLQANVDLSTARHWKTGIESILAKPEGNADSGSAKLKALLLS